jgi:protein O-mannosyl-transferase
LSVRHSRTDWIWCAGIVSLSVGALVIVVFFPVLDNGFVNWDDDKNFLVNPHYRGLGFGEARWAFTTHWLGVYQPLAWLAFEIQYVVYKLDPRGYHLTSLILHAVNTVFLFLLSTLLLCRSTPAASRKQQWAFAASSGLATAGFAVHPLRVEPVAWASCQPYLLCAFFSLLAVIVYVGGYDQSWIRRSLVLAGTFLLFVAALLSKVPAVMLPAVLLVLDVYPLRRFQHNRQGWFASENRMIWYEKTPFFAVSVLFAALAVTARDPAAATGSLIGLARRLPMAFQPAFYFLRETVFPINLVVVHPKPSTADWDSVRVLASEAGVLAVSGVLLLLRRHWPGLLAAWVVYLVSLTPTSGIIPFGGDIFADRYTYLVMMCWTVIVAACFSRLWQTTMRMRMVSVGLTALAMLVLLGLALLTWNQCQTWRSSETLWVYTLEHESAESATAHYNLAIALCSRGQLERAEAHCEKAIELNSQDFTIHNFLGIIYERLGNSQRAAAKFADAIALNPNDGDAQYNMGTSLSRQGQFVRAARHYREAIRIDPNYADAHHNLGIDRSVQGKLAEAEAHFNDALRLNPGRADTHANLGIVLAREGKREAAIAHLEEALRLDPGSSDARQHLESVRSQRRDAATHPGASRSN